MQTHVIRAVFSKEFLGYFANPTGYVFITLFVFLSGLAAFWLPGFFDRNLANLDQLNTYFPFLLLLIVPAITMNSWASERQEGTDELLQTLPASDLELVVGKYFGCVAIYAVCLLFASTHTLVLAFLGRPDLGLTLATYLGYFLAGAALCGVGLAASSLSSSPTISYIASVVLCGALLMIDLVVRLAPGTLWASFADALSLPRRLESVSRGVIALADVGYFVGVAAIGVGACIGVVTARRHAGARRGLGSFIHLPIRGLSLAAALALGVILLDRLAFRVDATAERLWSLSSQTRAIIAELPRDRSLVVSAYLSPRVPRAFVQQEETIVGLLREIESESGGRIQTRVVRTEPNTEAAREAERSYGITPRIVAGDEVGQSVPLFLGLAVSGGGSGRANVIEFMDRGLSAEYELARALRSAGTSQRKRVGVLDTRVGLFGQFDFQTMQTQPDWPIIAELRKQYDVVRTSAKAEIPADVGVLIVPQPSSLPQEELDRVVAYVKSGRPAIILEDPMPLVIPQLATNEPAPPATAGGPPAGPKADLSALWAALGARVGGDAVLWDTVNPHPQLRDVPNEFLFLPRGAWREGLPPFSDESPITAGLQELVLLFSGRVERIEPKPGEPGREFATLVRSSPSSGEVAYATLLQRSPMGMTGFNPDRRPTRVGRQQAIAARVTGQGEGNTVNALLIADLDVISPTFFELRQAGTAGLEFDNVTFILNAVDVLAGDESLVELRKKRRQFRTLERLEERRRAEELVTQTAVDNAEAEAQKLLGEARQRFDERIREIEARPDLDETTKRIMVESVRQSEQRRLDAQSRAIEDQKRQKIEDAQLATSQEVERLQMAIRVAAVTLPPVPALLVGLGVMVRRRSRERASVIARLEGTPVPPSADRAGTAGTGSKA
jgi:ABC-2 type transport system permease protein